MAARSEQIRAEAATILQHATVAGIKRRALDLTPIPDDPREPVRGRPRKKKPRAILVFPARYARLLQACMCLRAR
jgi:hypothetical protein